MTTKLVVRERRVVVGGVPTRTLEVEGEGPSILLLHGFTDSADTWRPVLTALAGAGRRAVAVDLPGQGHAPPLQPPVLEHLDRFVHAFVLAHAGDGPVVLAGNSLGGLLALRAAGDHRLPIAAVAGLGPAGLAYSRRARLVSLAARLLNPALVLLEHLPIPDRAVRRLVLRTHRRLTEGAGLEVADYYASHITTARDLSRLGRDLIALGKADRLGALRPADITVPVLLVWGARDRLADVRGAPLLLDAVVDAELVVLDCGHLPQVQVPHEVTELLSRLPALPEVEVTR
jgi:pimeloyl-ACP methyl ester carboxylesterase